MSTMISAAMNAKLNEQVTNELAASHSYLAMSCAFDELGLKVLSKRFFAQADEERDHALKLVKYIQEVGGTVTLDAVPKPKAKYGSPLAILKAALDAELNVTQQVNELVGLADKEKDYASRSFLQWFVDEQVEEVASMRHLVQLAELAKDMFQVENRLRHEMMEEK